MPLTSDHPNIGLLDASAADLGCGTAWESVHRVSPPAPLTCRGCGAAMSAKVSPRGLRFFAHRAAAPHCPSNGETLAHRLLKVELATAVRAAGWQADLEVAGEGWRADVLATSPDGGRRIAWEAQLASATVEDLAARTSTMRASGVEVCWVTDKDTVWVTHVPSARIAPQAAGDVKEVEDAETGRGLWQVIEGHAIFEPDSCGSTCGVASSRWGRHSTSSIPCPGHGAWRAPGPVQLARFVAAVCSGSIHAVTMGPVHRYQHSRHPGGDTVWTTREYWLDSRAQAAATERYQRWLSLRQAADERAAAEWEAHRANIEALLKRQSSLTRAAVELTYRETGTYPRIGSSGPPWAMGVPVFVLDQLFAVICPVASRITTQVREALSGAVILVADDAERHRLAGAAARGQRIEVLLAAN